MKPFKSRQLQNIQEKIVGYNSCGIFLVFYTSQLRNNKVKWFLLILEPNITLVIECVASGFEQGKK